MRQIREEWLVRLIKEVIAIQRDLFFRERKHETRKSNPFLSRTGRYKFLQQSHFFVPLEARKYCFVMRYIKFMTHWLDKFPSAFCNLGSLKISFINKETQIRTCSATKCKESFIFIFSNTIAFASNKKKSKISLIITAWIYNERPSFLFTKLIYKPSFLFATLSFINLFYLQSFSSKLQYVLFIH